MRLVLKVDTGQTAVNQPTSGWDVHLPFGGFEASGSMSKPQWTEGLDSYTGSRLWPSATPDDSGVVSRPSRSGSN